MNLILSFLVFTVQVLLNGVALKLLWGWFIPFIFGGLPLLSWLNAVGICLVVATTQQIIRASEQTFEFISFQILTPFVLIGLGWIVHSFM